jgi:hypothetical protein
MTVEYRMARGFESKDVEYQQAEAASRAPAAPPASAAERRMRERRRSLELSLTRMRTDLSLATNPAHRAMLDTAIASLEGELAELLQRPGAGDTPR